MTSDVVTWRKIESRQHVLHVLESTQFSGFPVLTETSRVLAVVTRDELVKRLCKATDVVDLSDLHPSFNAFIVESNHDFLRCYRLFRHLGLRHMVVVDNKTKAIAGMVTRADLVKTITSVPKPHFYYVTL